MSIISRSLPLSLAAVLGGSVPGCVGNPPPPPPDSTGTTGESTGATTMMSDTTQTTGTTGSTGFVADTTATTGMDIEPGECEADSYEELDFDCQAVCVVISDNYNCLSTERLSEIVGTAPWWCCGNPIFAQNIPYLCNTDPAVCEGAGTSGGTASTTGEGLDDGGEST